MKKWYALGLVALLVGADQLIKQWALQTLEPVSQIEVIPGLFNLTYIENRGAAFGILQGKTIILSVISGVLLFVILCAMLSEKFKSNFLLWCVSIGLAGGLGNFYDRVARGFVVDYLDFSALFGFPVFNLADCCVVIATVLILIYCVRFDMGSKSKIEQSEAEADNPGHETD